jgi:hypothetical protein
VADFLLAWWNAPEYGGFDLTDVWAVDAAIAQDMLAVFSQIVHSRSYPDSLGYEKQFDSIVRQWRSSSRNPSNKISLVLSFSRYNAAAAKEKNLCLRRRS